MKSIVSIAAALLLAGSLSGCGSAAVMALGTAASAAGIAKDMFDIDISVHSLLTGRKPEQPIPPTALITHPELVITTPPPGVTPAPVPLLPDVPPANMR